MAIAADADFLVTGDSALQALHRVGATRIVSPRRFLLHITR
jgi:predicted nucleic acid-binding protein